MREYVFVLASVRARVTISLRNVSLAPNQSSRIIMCTHCKSKAEVFSPEKIEIAAIERKWGGGEE